MEDIASQDINASSCFGTGSVAGAVIGTFLTTILLSAVAALLYKQWRRHKGKHLVLVTDPEIVEDAYAFDNPCFKDATPAVGRISADRSISMVPDTPAKDSTRWSTPWTSLGIGSTNRNDKRRTLDDSCLGPKATRVSVVSLRSRDFTGLGFNVCGNMREGIFVKDLLHRGPASESGRIHPGDRIASVKISFRNMVYEDALTILSYASPYDVELEVESGGTGSKPATLLKKTVGPSPTRICHPLYRSQSIPELSQAHKSSAKRLFIADPNESVGSNYSTMNSTLKSSKSTPGSHTLERRHDEAKNNHHKFGIKVLPALDGTVHRIENQNEHNTNLERRHSKKMDVEKHMSSSSGSTSVNVTDGTSENLNKVRSAEPQQRTENLSNILKSNKRTLEMNGIDVLDNPDKSTSESITIPSEVPAEVHNAAMAARRNRKNSSELLNSPKVFSQDSNDIEDLKSPPKNKRKAPAPPKTNNSNNEPPDVVTPVKKIVSPSRSHDLEKEDAIDSIADYTESLSDYVNKVRDITDDTELRRPRLESHIVHRRNSESDTDSEVQNSFTTIELNPADITIHRTPVPEVNDDEEDDVYRKAASLGDLSKYESKTSTPLERAQSLDMTDTGAKKRKAPLPPEDINESTEDLTKLDQIDTFDKCKLKKSNEWGTLEDVLWTKEEEDDRSKKPRTRKKSNSTLERSKSAVEIKLKDELLSPVANERLDDIETDVNETSIELYNLPLSKRLTQEFIHAERMFNPDEDNSLARIVNDGMVVKSPTLEEMELDFRQAKPLSNDDDEDDAAVVVEENDYDESPVNEDFNRALRYFEMHASKSPTVSNESTKINLTRLDEWREESSRLSNDATFYAGKKAVIEEPITKILVDKKCRGCEEKYGQHEHNCKRHSIEPIKDKRYHNDSQERNRQSTLEDKSFESVHSTNVKELSGVGRSSTPTHSKVHFSKSEAEVSKMQELKSNEFNADNKEHSVSTFHVHRSKFEEKSDQRERYSPVKSKSPMEPLLDSQFTKRNVGVSNNKKLGRDDEREEEEEEEEEEEDEYEFGSNVTVNSKNLSSPNNDRHNISNVSVSSGENSEDSGLVRESIDYNLQESESRPPLPSTPMPNSPQKMTYITEIKVSANRDNIHDLDSESEDVHPVTGNNGEARKLTHHEITVTSNGKPTSGKKPPVPPRRSDITKMAKEDKTEKHVVYVSEYKSTTGKDSQTTDINLADEKQSEAANKKFEHWIFLGDNKDQNRWGNGSSQPQSVTNIMLSSGDDKMIHQ
uniref:enolase-phosphatase E1-like n=1 Tax=Vespula vulgaris TaxID=7454 RepID=UPI002126BFE6|nr:enolase-phosphatase E1-like [Vespula vulgaris]